MVRATQPQNSRFVTDEAKAVHDETVNRYVMFGSSPRGAQALILGAKVRALLDGRANVAREDIEHVAALRAGPSHNAQLRRAIRRNRRRAHRRARHQVGSRGESIGGRQMLEARAFEPEYLRKLDRLVLGIKRARTVRAGQRALGRVQGLGIEPENFKEYAPGDDLRFLDWNAFARLDELMLRTYRADRQVEVTSLIDASASMGLPSATTSSGSRWRSARRSRTSGWPTMTRCESARSRCIAGR